VSLVFYPFHIMVILGIYFIVLFAVVLILSYRKKIEHLSWLQWICLLTIPLGYVAGEAGWMVAEIGRQPWAIQDILPVQVAVSSISAESVRLTFFLFLILFTSLLVAEIGIMVKQIKKGPGAEKIEE
jgi:cytochrome d ubiquinol oxidase subunit I